MIGPLGGTAGIFPGPPDFALLHERAMPQKDQLCGAFWRSLALSAAGHAASQEEVALLAGTTLAEGDPANWLPPGASPRTDYEATIPLATDEASAGTSATGVARNIEELSGGALSVVSVAGPWTAQMVFSLVEIAGAQAPECALIANLRTGRLLRSRPPARLLLNHLLGRTVEAPPPDWDCGHFLTIAACVGGPGGALVVLRGTYRQLGWDGYHLQPAAVVAAACPHLALTVLADLHGIEKSLPGPNLVEGDPSELEEEERRRLGLRSLPNSLAEALGALEADAVARSWLSEDLLDCYLSVKRTEISLLDGADPKEACERYLSVY